MTSNQGRTVGIIIAVAIGAGIVFFGLQQFKYWHEEKLQAAIEQEREKSAQQAAALKKQLEQLEQEVAENEPAAVPEDRIAEVFGEPITEDPIEMASGEKNSDPLERKIRAFFDYLDKKGVTAPDSGGSQAVFNRMISDLSEHPPVVIGETRDLISLLHNQAHFFRTLDKERLELVLNIMKTEKDVLEPALAVFYDYYTCEECTATRTDSPVDLETLYEYSAFFLNTLSGKSYIMRRDSAIGSLTRYYSIRVLDKANDEGANAYGLDIRPHIEQVYETIRNQNNLRLKDDYMEKLEQLIDKYQIHPAVKVSEVQ